MKNFIRLFAIIACTVHAAVYSSNLNSPQKYRGKLPNLQTIATTAQPESTRRTIINKGQENIDKFYQTYNLDKDQAIQFLTSMQLPEFIEALSTPNHDSYINKDHETAIKLQEVINIYFKKNTKKSNKQMFEEALKGLRLTTNDLLQLENSCSHGMLNAISLYLQKRNSQSPLNDLLPALATLQKNVHEESSKIPFYIRSTYTSNKNHPINQFNNLTRWDQSLDKAIEAITMYNRTAISSKPFIVKNHYYSAQEKVKQFRQYEIASDLMNDNDRARVAIIEQFENSETTPCINI